MALNLKSSASEDGNADIQAIMNDIASLRKDISALASNIGNNALNATSDATRKAAAQVGDQASRVYDNIASQSQRSAKALNQQLEEQPIATLLIAFALGCVGSHLLSNKSR